MIKTIIIVLLCLIALIPALGILVVIHGILWAWACEDYIDDEETNTIEQ